jgi:hypothetical protein
MAANSDDSNKPLYEEFERESVEGETAIHLLDVMCELRASRDKKASDSQKVLDRKGDAKEMLGCKLGATHKTLCVSWKLVCIFKCQALLFMKCHFRT